MPGEGVRAASPSSVEEQEAFLTQPESSSLLPSKGEGGRAASTSSKPASLPPPSGDGSPSSHDEVDAFLTHPESTSPPAPTARPPADPFLNFPFLQHELILPRPPQVQIRPPSLLLKLPSKDLGSKDRIPIPQLAHSPWKPLDISPPPPSEQQNPQCYDTSNQNQWYDYKTNLGRWKVRGQRSAVNRRAGGRYRRQCGRMHDTNAMGYDYDKQMNWGDYRYPFKRRAKMKWSPVKHMLEVGGSSQQEAKESKVLKSETSEPAHDLLHGVFEDGSSLDKSLEEFGFFSCKANASQEAALAEKQSKVNKHSQISVVETAGSS